MFVNKLSHISRAYTSKRKKYFNVKSLTYYFHVKMMILANFQICISALLFFLRLRVTQKALQMPLFSSFCSSLQQIWMD